MIFMYKNKEGTIMMKKYWRKMMALTCAAAMLFTMAGCGNAEGTTDGAETAQSSTTADGSGEITIQFAELSLIHI